MHLIRKPVVWRGYKPLLSDPDNFACHSRLECAWHMLNHRIGEDYIDALVLERQVAGIAGETNSVAAPVICGVADRVLLIDVDSQYDQLVPSRILLGLLWNGELLTARKSFPEMRRSGTDIEHNVAWSWVQQVPKKIEFSSSGLQVEPVLDLTYETQIYSSASEIKACRKDGR